MKSKPFAITLDPRSSLANHTGTWRTERPVYADTLAPCDHACPAGETPQGWLAIAEQGRYEQAWQLLVRDNPFPAVMGRVCYHPCETACNRRMLDTAVGINSVERFLGDSAIEKGWTLPPAGRDTGKRVLIVGAGPAGLSTAYHLRRQGHAVEIRDAGEHPGGMMRSAIPTFRLPRDVLDLEIARLFDLGVTLRTNTRVHDLQAVREEGFDAVFLAIGAELSHRAYVPAHQAARVMTALDLLGEAADGHQLELGRTVVVYGGGNTAMDAARTARRFGAHDAVVVYRRTQERMPADASEVREAAEEGVTFRWLSTIAEARDGRVRIERMRLDDAGVPQPTGEYDEIAGDCVVLALGQDVDRSLLAGTPAITVDAGLVRVDARMMTGEAGVFAGGDATDTTRSVTASLGHGRQAADHIDAWLRGRTEPAAAGVEPIGYDRLNTWYYSDAPHAVRPRLDAARRVDDFQEVVTGLDQDTALYEARRCLSCGHCFGCDNCFGVCPDNAIHKIDAPDGERAYEIDYDYCKGCGLCVAECPSGAIEVEPEPS
ncbi:MAG TPA: NAD(P)-binding protein [Jatrophihabitans sp.]|jgi:NADPH-dependent glutamate synthase beta subunit-like oxidoreductase